jgi:CopA family copper-resistance protein
VDEFRLATAETIDVIVQPQDDSAYTIFAQSLDRSGYARATLAPRAGMSAPVPVLDRRAVLTMGDMGHGSMGHAMKGAEGSCSANMGHAMGAMVEHPPSEEKNPFVDMQTMMPSNAIDDPGIGLRAEQLRSLRDDVSADHRVLTLADLHSVFDDPDGREPGRDIELHLTGHMERYVWSFDGVRFDDAEPLHLRYGERVRLKLVNDTMMEHPIHLHGMWSDVENPDGAFHVRKHTVSVPPGHTRSYRVTADALGRWAYHCHLVLHMEAGMFREVRVTE